QIGAKGLVWVRCEADGTFKSSVDKFYDSAALAQWASKLQAGAGDLMLVLSGDADKTRKALGELRLYVAQQLGLRNKETFSALWVLDFPLLEWNEETKRWHAMHHPFTS